ncbi:hypothetical protein Ddye_022929 [Dipteronia dyeriana]|uniref:Uncharacterized protein n=1 Tax=Dipteronia dyeriana TaxID=168575 RepID=A0AAD9TSM2_9ROSI|nr:hypothetical protein Ddye_022929 [Dipteronia dyeriana]
MGGLQTKPIKAGTFALSVYIVQSVNLPSELSNGVVSSSTWRYIAFGATLITQGLRWRVGSGEHTRFWVDDWVPDTVVLKDHDLVDLSVGMLSQVVSDFLVDGQWIFDQLAMVFSWHIIHRTASIHAGRNSSGSDRAI